jgi:hypothetical protein
MPSSDCFLIRVILTSETAVSAQDGGRHGHRDNHQIVYLPKVIWIAGIHRQLPASAVAAIIVSRAGSGHRLSGPDSSGHDLGQGLTELAGGRGKRNAAASVYSFSCVSPSTCFTDPPSSTTD